MRLIAIAQGNIQYGFFRILYQLFGSFGHPPFNYIFLNTAAIDAAEQLFQAYQPAAPIRRNKPIVTTDATGE